MGGGILRGDRLGERGDRNQVQNGCEGLGLHDRPVVAGANDRRLHEVAGALERVATIEQLAPGVARAGDGSLVALDGVRVDQRAHERLALQRIADAHLPVGMNQAPLQLRGDRLVGEHAPRAGAALAGGADGAKNDRRHREVEVGGLVDDDGVVATELEQALAEARGDALPDLAADLGRTGEGDERHAPVRHEARRQLRAGLYE